MRSMQMKHRLTRFNSSWIKTITFDNVYHYKIAQDLKAKTYFTRPYTLKIGTVENRLEKILPKENQLDNDNRGKRSRKIDKLQTN